MDRFYIQGPCRLAGEVRASGAKNAALPALAASLLTDEPLVLHNLPDVRDIRTFRRVLEILGIAIEPGAEGSVRLQGTPRTVEAPYELVKTMRASVLVLGPTLSRRGFARVSLPGGCAIGVRPIDQHLAGLEALGAEVRLEHGYVVAEAERLQGARFRFATPTVGGTENVLMAAVLARGTTVLSNCAREPEVVDLIRLLVAMGARIEGAGTQTLVIEGVEELGGGEHRVIPDRIEIGTYLMAAAITGGDVTVTDAGKEIDASLGPLLELLREVGARVDVDREADAIRLSVAEPLVARDVETAPHPGFPTDLQAQYLALMTQARGVARIRETVFENRFQHVAELTRMGAAIDVDGRVARVEGPTPLSGARVMATDLRASACLVLAGLAAEGETVVDRIYHLDRGYEAMESKLQNLGASLSRRSEPMGS